MFEDIEVKYNEPSAGIVQVILNRPKKLNAMRMQTLMELQTLFESDFKKRLTEIKTVVIASCSPNFFSSGLDLSCPSVIELMSPSSESPASRSDFLRETILKLQKPLLSIANFPRPVICAISGVCFGLGIDLACACDIRVVANTAILSVREVKIGICADLGSLFFLPRVCGNDSWVREISFTGRTFGADEALRFGFASSVSEDAHRSALQTAEEIACNETVALEGTKENLNFASRDRMCESFDYVAVWNSVKLQDTEAIARALSRSPEVMGDSSPNRHVATEPSFEHSIPSFVVAPRRRDSFDEPRGCVAGCLPGAGRRSTRFIESLSEETGLSVKEITALRERFSKIAPKGYMSLDQFQQTLGMLGMTPNNYIPQRMFSVFDSNGDKSLTFEEYLRAFAVLLRGSEENRLRLSFKLADTSGSGQLVYDDFRALVEACQSTSMALLESSTALISEPEIRDLFFEISGGKSEISISDYMQAVRGNNRFLSIIGLMGSSGRVGRAPLSRQSPPGSPGSLDELRRLKADLASLRKNLQGEAREEIDKLLQKYEKNEPISRPTSRPGSPQPAVNRSSVSASADAHKGHRMLGPKRGMAVHFGHENWNMVLSMMIGIRLAVGRASFEINRPLTNVDFFVKDKFSIVPQLSNILDSKISSSVKVTRFIDYAPLVFRKLREEISGISEADYIRSVGPEQLLGNMVLGNLSSLAEQTSEGKGGAFFYYTADGRFMIKTVTREEKHLLKDMLRDYYEYLSRNKDSFIVRFYGLHGLRLKRDPLLFQQGKYRKDEKIFFVVMGNLFNTPLEVHRRFDLKGSWVGRSTGNASMLDPSVALRDNDFISRKERICVGPNSKEIICSQLRRDVDFFASRNIIDYSLLLGIHDRRFATEASQNWNEDEEMGQARSFQSTDGSCVYYLGVIDILCEYNTRKKLENIFKSIRYDSKGISAIPAKDYADRFYNFISDHIE